MNTYDLKRFLPVYSRHCKYSHSLPVQDNALLPVYNLVYRSIRPGRSYWW